jgi:CMP-N-acetylneuraminic acid synthetase
MITIEGGEIQNYLHDFNPTGNRQEFFELYIPSGSVYVFSIENFIENGFKIPIKGAIPIEVQNEKLIDINTEYDLLVAQRIGENFEFSN